MKFQSRYEIFVSPLPVNVQVADILRMFEKVGTIKLRSSFEKTYSYRIHSGLQSASCRITFTDERAAREAIARFDGTELNGVKMKVSPARGSYPYQPRSSTDWNCPSCESLMFDYQNSCYGCHKPRGAKECIAGSSRSRERGEEGERKMYSRSPATHRRSGEERNREYQERYERERRRISKSPTAHRRSSENSSHSHSRDARSPWGPQTERRLSDPQRSFDGQKKTEGEENPASRDTRSPWGPQREHRLSDHQRPRVKREEERSFDGEKKTEGGENPARRPQSREEKRGSPIRRENHPSGSNAAVKRPISSESPHRDFKREESSGGKRFRHEEGQAARDENFNTDILNTLRRWFKAPISVDIQIKPRSAEAGLEGERIKLKINNEINSKPTVGTANQETKISSDSGNSRKPAVKKDAEPITPDNNESTSSSDEEMKKMYRAKIDQIKVEAKDLRDFPLKDAKAAKKRQKFDFEEDKKIVDMVLENLGDNLIYRFDIPSRGLEKLSAKLSREEKSVQSRWRYNIREWIKEDEEDRKEDWSEHGQAALDRRVNIVRYFKRQTEKLRGKTVDKGH